MSGKAFNSRVTVTVPQQVLFRWRSLCRARFPASSIWAFEPKIWIARSACPWSLVSVLSTCIQHSSQEKHVVLHLIFCHSDAEIEYSYVLLIVDCSFIHAAQTEDTWISAPVRCMISRTVSPPLPMTFPAFGPWEADENSEAANTKFRTTLVTPASFPSTQSLKPSFPAQKMPSNAIKKESQLTSLFTHLHLLRQVVHLQDPSWQRIYGGWESWLSAITLSWHKYVALGPLGQHWLALILQNCAISKLAVADLSKTHSEFHFHSLCASKTEAHWTKYSTDQKQRCVEQTCLNNSFLFCHPWIFTLQ